MQLIKDYVQLTSQLLKQKSLNPNKAHGHGNISICMLKICGDTICKPVEQIFKQALTTGVFSSERKKGNSVPCYKKATNKTLTITVQFVYFLFVENFLKDSYLMFSFFLTNNLLAPNHSGFKSSDSCINQLLSINHEIQSSFDEGFEFRSVFLDISKSFDTVWHEGIILNFSKTVFWMTC